jgi:hypothetical protein
MGSEGEAAPLTPTAPTAPPRRPRHRAARAARMMPSWADATAACALALSIGQPRRAALETWRYVMPGITRNELTLPTAQAAQQTEDV